MNGYWRAVIAAVVSVLCLAGATYMVPDLVQRFLESLEPPDPIFGEPEDPDWWKPKAFVLLLIIGLLSLLYAVWRFWNSFFGR